MKHIMKVSIAVACALGMSAAVAQNVPSDSSAKRPAVKEAQVRTPVQVAQAAGSAAGSTSSGASTAGATGAGVSSTTAALVTMGVVAAAIAVSTDDSTATTQH